jgi:glycosyltransferase involved in cell wall biosynthesis
MDAESLSKSKKSKTATAQEAKEPPGMKVIVAMPAYNVEKTLEITYNALSPSLRKHVLLGNNRSQDKTAEVAEKLGIQVITHDQNYGYGGNLKRLYREALRQGADVVVEVHPDYQYEPSIADMLVEYVVRGHFDVIQGNRIRSRDESLAGGMHLYRYLGNRALTLFENLWFGVTFGEWHSGMRAYRASVLEALPLESYPDTHAFASDILMDCVMHGFRVAEVPVPVRYEAQSSSVSVPGLFAYAGRTVAAALKRPPWKKKPYGSAPR